MYIVTLIVEEFFRNATQKSLTEILLSYTFLRVRPFLDSGFVLERSEHREIYLPSLSEPDSLESSHQHFDQDLRELIHNRAREKNVRVPSTFRPKKHTSASEGGVRFDTRFPHEVRG